MEPKLLHLCNNGGDGWFSSPGMDVTRERAGAHRGRVGQRFTPLKLQNLLALHDVPGAGGSHWKPKGELCVWLAGEGRGQLQVSSSFYLISLDSVSH